MYYTPKCIWLFYILDTLSRLDLDLGKPRSKINRKKENWKYWYNHLDSPKNKKQRLVDRINEPVKIVTFSTFSFERKWYSHAFSWTSLCRWSIDAELGDLGYFPTFSLSLSWFYWSNTNFPHTVCRWCNHHNFIHWFFKHNKTVHIRFYTHNLISVH